MPKVKVTFECEVAQDWVDLVTKETDLFVQGYCGYWLRGAVQSDKLGWLCCELSDESEYPTPTPEIHEAWERRRELPEGWYRLNEKLACRSWALGVKKWGTDWLEIGDAEKYDVVIQESLLGEIRYG
jgi:hypothetical protein